MVNENLFELENNIDISIKINKKDKYWKLFFKYKNYEEIWFSNI